MLLQQILTPFLKCHGELGTPFPMGWRGSSGEVLRTGDRSREWTSHRLSGPVSL